MKASSLEKQIRTIFKDISFNEAERDVFFSFIKVNNLDISKNSFLLDYFAGFSENEKISSSIDDFVRMKPLEWLVDVMGLLVPDFDKESKGIVFTPDYIADFIVKFVKPGKDDVSVDISCGCGVFVLSLIKYYKETYNLKIFDVIKNRVYGFDILDYNIRRCKVIVALFALMNDEIVSESDFNFYVCDSIRNKWKMKFDIIVGNPPYVKFQDLSIEDRSFLFENYECTKSGTYNLFYAFFELGYNLLNESGRLSYITPNNYFTSLSGKQLREFIKSKRCISHIIDFASEMIFQVRTYTAITFINKKRNESIQYSRIEENHNINDFLNNLNFTTNDYDDLKNEKWRLLCGQERENIFKIENTGFKLGKIFDIYASIATLKDDVYAIEPYSEDDEFCYIEKSGKKYKIEKSVTRPLVKISDIKNQDDLTFNNKRVIFPYYIDNEKVNIIPEDEFSEKYKNCYQYLLSEKDALNSRSKGKVKFEPFYKWGRMQTVNKFGKKLLTPTFSKKARFLIDEIYNGMYSNGYGIYPKKENENLIDEKLLISLEENLDVLQKILNSEIMNYYIKKTSVSIEGGYPCFQKNFIEKFSIPDLNQSEIDYLRKESDNEKIDEFLKSIYKINPAD